MRETVALPPLLVPVALNGELDAERATRGREFGAVSLSRTSVFTHLVSIGLRDLAAELAELSTPVGAAIAREGSGTTFLPPSPPRGSRWTTTSSPTEPGADRPSTTGRAPAGFVRFTTMVVTRQLLDDVEMVRDAYDRLAPGRVLSRAALLREALARGLAAQQSQRRLVDEMRRMMESAPTVGFARSAEIPLAALFPTILCSPKRSTTRATASRPIPRARARRTRRKRTKGDDADEGEPPPAPPLGRARPAVASTREVDGG